MLRYRKESDSDRAEKLMQATNFPTKENLYELYCDLCGENFFVNEILFDRVTRAIRAGFENPFVCDDCRRESDEEAYF